MTANGLYNMTSHDYHLNYILIARACSISLPDPCPVRRQGAWWR